MVQDVTVETSFMVPSNLFLGSILMITPVVLITIFNLYCLWDVRLFRNVSDWSQYITGIFFPQYKIFMSLYFATIGITRCWNKTGASQRDGLKISYMHWLLCLPQERLSLHSPATLSHTIKEEVQGMQLVYSPQEFPLVEYVEILPAVSLSGLLGCFGRQRALNGNVTIAGWFFSSQHW